MWKRVKKEINWQIEKFAARLASGLLNDRDVVRRLDSALSARWEAKTSNAKNSLLRHGAKYFSQSDEDGILIEVLKRLNIKNGTFVEIGVGNGLENNTLILLMLGWRGLWLGGEEIAFSTDASTRLNFHKLWVTPQNVGNAISEGLAKLQLHTNHVDVLSVDVDSFDRDVVEAILAAGMRPSVIVVEYNAKFPPPIRFSVSPGESWDLTDYMGCSLQSWWDLLVPAGYRLIACNVTGVNAFFVKAEESQRFEEVPTDIDDLFMPCDYARISVGHPPSPKTIIKFL